MTPPQRPDVLAAALASEYITRKEAFASPIDYSAISTIVGFASFTTKTLLYFPMGRLVYVVFYFVGVSNNTLTSFTLPYTSMDGYTTRYYSPIRYVDGGVASATPGRAGISQNANVCNLFTSWSASPWTNTGNKEAQGELWYFRA